MSHTVNQRAYDLWAPAYDLLFASLSARPRARAMTLLALRPGERLLIPGVGTGLDLRLLPAGLAAIGLDFNPAMLAQARRKVNDSRTRLLHGDAQQLPFREASFDAVLFSLVLSVVPDAVQTFRESWRVLRPGGRAVIFDKFLPEQSQLSRGRRLIGGLIRVLGTDPNRKLSEIVAGVPDVRIVRDEPSLLRGQYRVLLLEKTSCAPSPDRTTA
jgi:phosphatidylethanolamine/phosphatidyl-N-methylethanolamine N-methyltransferase